MTDPTDDAERSVALGEADLDGHTLEELSDYLDAGRTPLDPSIEASPACRNALAALERLQDIAGAMLRHEAAARTRRDDAWVADILAGINLDAHAGADFPIGAAGPAGGLLMTEGALRGLVRRAGDVVPGFLVGRVRFEGDLADPVTPIRVGVTANIVQGYAIPAAVAALRHAVRAEVERHTALTVGEIDVTVRDLQLSDPAEEPR